MKSLVFAALVVFSLISLSGCSPGDISKANKPPQRKQMDLGPQELEMVFARLIPGTSSLSIKQGHDYIKTEELELLREHGVSGELFARGIFRRGEGEKKAHILVVMATNVTAGIDLKQPDGTNGIWLQRGTNFLLLPTNTPTITKSLRIERYDHPMGDETTHYSIDMGYVVQGGTAIVWEK